MSSKFFTWGHKGDKKSSPFGVVPIPAECITIQGIDAKSPDKARRRPLPLDLYQPPDSSINERNRADESIALHDAAVQSATSLLAVINDCLKSPPLNAHFMTSQQQQSRLQPMHGRPRSRTAPSTPMAEAPSGSQMSPVELPGSMPYVKKTHASHQSMDSRALRTIMTQPTDTSSLGQSIERPHSSPQESSHKMPSHPRQSSDSFSRSLISLQPPLDPVPRAKTGSPYRRSQLTRPAPFNTSDDTLVASESDVSPRAVKRSPLYMLSPRQPDSTSIPPDSTPFQSDDTSFIRALSPAAANKPGTVQHDRQARDIESILMEQISVLRSAHDAHLRSLKEAHEKEVASYRSYVSFLERRIATQTANNQTAKQHLTLDTSHLPNKEPSVLSSEASATNSMQSFEMTLENQKRASSEAAAEAQKLRRERDHLKDATERNERRVSQLRGIVRKAKENETALKNAIAGLEASLLSANNERLDVLEGFHEACEQVRLLGRERDELRNRLCYIDPKLKHVNRITPTPSVQMQADELMQRNSSLRRDKLLQKLDEVRQTLSERNMRIEELELQIDQHQVADSNARDDSKNAILDELDQCRQQLANVQADRDRYDSLLHTELRRQSRLAAQKAHTTTPKLETEVLTAMRERLNALKDTSNTPNSSHSGKDVTTSTLEKELEHCFKEIIMYKLDIKGYKKDLKQANAEIETLRSQPVQPSTKTPTRQTTPATQPERELQPGLGITMPPLPTTPQRTVPSATASALLSSTTASTPQPQFTSPTRPKTPLTLHKKLPKPPPRTPSPYTPPKALVQRQETLRSLSESIISSYAKRSTPEQEMMATPPRGRSSDPPRMSVNGEGSNARAVPMARFTPRMLKTSMAKTAGAAAIT